jgi:ACS family glucarate transporter-like MFS transporter
MNPKGNFRWVIVGLLLVFSIVGYILRGNVSISFQLIKIDYGLDNQALGNINFALLAVYTLCQVPAGALADRLGPRRVLVWAAAAWCVLTLLCGWLPGTLFGSAGGVVITLMVLRGLLGAAQAPTYPGGSRIVANWLPISERGLACGILIAGALIGSAAKGPLIAELMVPLGWRASFYVTAALAAIVCVALAMVLTDRPDRHRRVRAAEGDTLAAATGPASSPPAAVRIGWGKLMRSRSVWALFFAYFMQSYLTYLFIFWFFTYLVDVRKFGLISGGWMSSWPDIVGAVACPLGGAACDALTRRWGPRWGRRGVPLISLPLIGLVVFLGVRVENANVAVALLSLGMGLAIACEGAFWSSMTDIASSYAGTATGFLNFGGNLGGTLSVWLAPTLADRLGLGLPATFTLAGFLAAASALIWLMVDAGRPVDREAAKA